MEKLSVAYSQGLQTQTTSFFEIESQFKRVYLFRFKCQHFF